MVLTIFLAPINICVLQPNQQPHTQPQPGHSSSHTSTPFGNLPIGGKALGTIAGVLKEGIYRKFPLARGFL